MGIMWEMPGMGCGSPCGGSARQAGKPGQENSWQQEAMDSLPVGFCDALYTTNGFVTEVMAGHVISIKGEDDG